MAVSEPVKLMTNIEKIRVEVEMVRKEHVHIDREDVEEGPLCGAKDCCYLWPCPTLRLAEDKLKLAEALEDALIVTRNYYAYAISRGVLEKHQEKWLAALGEVAQ